MRCIPYKSYKKLNTNSLTFYQWYKYSSQADTYMYMCQSFNDQPSERTAISLIWESKNEFHRLYNKPAFYGIPSKGLEFYINGFQNDDPSDIHKDYRNE